MLVMCAEDIKNQTNKEQLHNRLLDLYKSQRIRKIKLIYENGEVKTERLGKTADDRIIVMNKGSRTYGDFILNMPIKDFQVIENNDSQKWIKSINKAIAILNKSGLWLNVKEELETARDIGYDKLQNADKIFWSNFEGVSYKEQEQMKIELIKAIDPRLIKTREDKTEYINTDILWNWSKKLKIKKMYFGKNFNDLKLKEIADALKNKKEIYVSGRSNYDISFEYKPENNKAFYSEEYKNCGNGYYYLAISEKYALFYEKD